MKEILCVKCDVCDKILEIKKENFIHINGDVFIGKEYKNDM